LRADHPGADVAGAAEPAEGARADVANAVDDVDAAGTSAAGANAAGTGSASANANVAGTAKRRSLPVVSADVAAAPATLDPAAHASASASSIGAPATRNPIAAAATRADERVAVLEFR